jgi:glycosyltransferase involved in cell wall biosynthesis
MSEKRKKVAISVILPCLNEEKTVGKCVRDALIGLKGKKGEVIVVDNGSTDDSVKIARENGAHIVREKRKGYGAALYKGIKAASGEYIILADADLSYDVRELGAFIKALKNGADVVIGNRFKGGIDSGAMPWLHQYIGNPVLTSIANTFFGTHIGDYHCGLRAIRKSSAEKLHLQCVGMEFASEMLVKASLHNFSIVEVPVTYRVDGRDRRSHLRTFRDGWRHLRFLMLFAPNWVFFFPAVIISLLSCTLLFWMLFRSFQLGEVSLGIHTMLVLGALLIIGYQLFHWSLCVAEFAQKMNIPVRSPKLIRFFSHPRVEFGIVLGCLSFLIGLAFFSVTFLQWINVGFGDLNPEQTMRIFIPGIIFMTLGVQIFFSSFFLGLLKVETITQS